jgi:hypothetical protein
MYKFFHTLYAHFKRPQTTFFAYAPVFAEKRISIGLHL